MRYIRLFLGVGLVCLLVSACVSKENYEQLEVTLSDTQAKLEKKNKKIQELESQLGESEANRNKCQQDATELQARFEKLENAQQQLSQTLKETKIELEKKSSMVKQKEAIIQEFDDTWRQLETNLQLQVEAREKKIIEQINIIAELDGTLLKIENSLQGRQSDIELREKRIKALQNAIAQRDKTQRQIEIDLKEQINARQVKLEKLAGKLKVTFIDRILFNSGSVQINPEGEHLLSTFSESFKHIKDQNVIVQGHTDNVLIGPELREKYPTNWELSTARSAAVVRYLTENAGVEPQWCEASGYSFYRPVASNETEDGRSQNRRIEIILTSRH